MKYNWEGYEVGDAEEAGKMCGGIKGITYQSYTRRDWNSYRNPPASVFYDAATGRKMYPLRKLPGYTRAEPELLTVEEWHEKRPGIGNWGGIGARAHYDYRDARRLP